MRKLCSFLLALVLLCSLLPESVVYAAYSNDELLTLTKKRQEPQQCVIYSAWYMARRRIALDADVDAAKKVTIDDFRSAAAVGNAIKDSFHYTSPAPNKIKHSFKRLELHSHGGNNSLTITELAKSDSRIMEITGGKAIRKNNVVGSTDTAKMKELLIYLLDMHPEGVVAWIYNNEVSPLMQHAVLITHYDGKYFMCADPAADKYCGEYFRLSETSLKGGYTGTKTKKTQNDILKYITALWIIADAAPRCAVDHTAPSPAPGSEFKTIPDPNNEGKYYAVCKECGQKYITGALDPSAAGIYSVSDSSAFLCASPYREAKVSDNSLLEGTRYTVIGRLTNAYGNTWLKTRENAWLYSGDVSLIQELDSASLSEITVRNETVPSGCLPKGKTFTVAGIISSNYRLNLVQAYIYDSNGSVVQKYKINPDDKSYNIKNDGLSEAFRFNELAIGQYRYVVTASDLSGNATELINEDFSVGTLSSGITITSQPEDYSGRIGEKATFAVVAQGSDLSFQWQFKDVGGEWKTSKHTTATASCDITEARDGRQYRCIISDKTGSVTSAAATLHAVGCDITITAQPEDVYGRISEKAVFTVAAVGSGLNYQWQFKDVGGEWKTSKHTTATASCDITEARDGRQYRCVISNGSKSVTSDAAALHVIGSGVTIVSQPIDFYGQVGEKAVFTITAAGSGLNYQWQFKDVGGEWNTSKHTTATASCDVTEARDGRQYRCIISNGSESVTSAAATLHIVEATVVITCQPTDYYGQIDEVATFTVEASGTGITYQWQESTDDGDVFVNIISSGYNTATLMETITDSRLNHFYRCVVTDVYGNVCCSDAVQMMKVMPLTITAQPDDNVGKVGSTAVFSVSAEGDEITYQWQMDSGNGWENATFDGNQTEFMTVEFSEPQLACLYRCVITDVHGNSVSSCSVQMIEAAPEIIIAECSEKRVEARFVTEEESAIAVCAIYDKDGRQLDIRCVAFSETEDIAFDFEIDSFDHAKLYLLTNGAVPLCESNDV